MSHLKPREAFLIVCEKLIPNDPMKTVEVEWSIAKPAYNTAKEAREAGRMLMETSLQFRTVYVCQVVEAGERVVQFEDGSPKVLEAGTKKL